MFNILRKKCLPGSFSSQIYSFVRCKATSFNVNAGLHDLNEDECTFRQHVHEFCQKELTPYSREIDKNNGWDELRKFWMKLGNMGLLGVTVPKCDGGLGFNYLKQFLAFEVFSQASPAIALSYGAHSNLCMNQLSLNANEDQKTRYFPKLLSGEHIGALAMSEVESGSDVVSMRLRADKKGDYYILNGSKFWITNGPDADVLIVYARTDQHALPEHSITTFIIDRGMDGFSTMPKLDKLGMRGSNTGELVFDNCKVPSKNIIGKVNRGIYILFKGLDIERAVLAAGCLGIMEACIDLAFPYVCMEKQNSSVNPLLQAKVVNMYTQLTVCRSYAYSVIRAIDNGYVVSKDCAGCALYASEKATQVAQDAMQCIGYDSCNNENPAGRFLLDSKLNEIGGGTNEIRRWLIGRQLNEDYLQ